MDTTSKSVSLSSKHLLSPCLFKPLFPVLPMMNVSAPTSLFSCPTANLVGSPLTASFL